MTGAPAVIASSSNPGARDSASPDIVTGTTAPETDSKPDYTWPVIAGLAIAAVAVAVLVAKKRKK